MKLRGLVTNFSIHGSDLYISKIGLIWNLYFPVLHEKTLGSTAGEERTAAWRQFPALPYKFPIWKNTDHKWKQIILVVNFLFGLRVNEIPNKIPNIGFSSALHLQCKHKLKGQSSEL
jgi:hypothetical protein